MVSLTDLVIKHHNEIKEGNPACFYNDIGDSHQSLDLSPDNFIEAEKMLVELRPKDILEMNIGIVAAYVDKQRDSEIAYEKIRNVLRRVADSPYLPEQARFSITILI